MPAPTGGTQELRLRLEGPTMPAQLPEVRRRIAGWAMELGLSADDVDDLVLATHEALANVADHAYDGVPGEALIHAECRGGQAVVVVRDRGRWLPPSSDNTWRGRGLLIIEGLAQHVDVHRGPTGTTVEMRWALPHWRNGDGSHGRGR
jgi:serine/threonine-protein kinase RsbW